MIQVDSTTLENASLLKGNPLLRQKPCPGLSLIHQKAPAGNLKQTRRFKPEQSGIQHRRDIEPFCQFTTGRQAAFTHFFVSRLQAIVPPDMCDPPQCEGHAISGSKTPLLEDPCDLSFTVILKQRVNCLVTMGGMTKFTCMCGGRSGGMVNYRVVPPPSRIPSSASLRRCTNARRRRNASHSSGTPSRR